MLDEIEDQAVEMTAQLTPEQEKAAEALVAAGLFESKAKAIAHYSPRGMQEEAEKLATLKAEIAQGIEEAEQGLCEPLDVDDMLTRLETRLQAKKDRADQA